MCPSLGCLPACLEMWVHDIFKILCLCHPFLVTKRLLIIASLTSRMARLPFFCGLFAIKPDDKKLDKTRLPQITLKFMQQKESYLSWPVHCIFSTRDIYGQDLALQCNIIWTFILDMVGLFSSIVFSFSNVKI